MVIEGTYYIRAFNGANGCEVIEPVQINLLPVVIINDPADVCIDGADMNFTATPVDGTFSTTAVAGFTSDGALGTATLDVSAAGAGTYDVTYDYTDGNGCMASQTVSVTVFEAADASVSATPSTCVSNTAQNDGSIQLTAVPVGNRFHWSVGTVFDDNGGANTYDNATPVAGPFPQTVATGLANPTGYQTYTVRVYNSQENCYIDLSVVLTEIKCCPTGNCGGVQVQINNN
jgi:hypothetical protein